jgi:type IV secretory pathway VirB3-like protein
VVHQGLVLSEVQQMLLLLLLLPLHSLCTAHMSEDSTAAQLLHAVHVSRGSLLQALHSLQACHLDYDPD